MGISQETIDQINRFLVRPLAMRVANLVARGDVKLVDDTPGQQALQIDGFIGGPRDDAEHWHPYGFSSVPLAGAEHVTIFLNGDPAHPLVIQVSDRRYRPTGGQPGEVTVYNNTGASIRITKDGDIVARPAPGRSMLVDDGSGAAALPTMADFNGIVSIMNSAGAGAGTNLPLAVTNYQTAHPSWPDGTKVFKGK